MIDLHMHILPGLDDGAEDPYDSVEMAQMAISSGTDIIVATPHCNNPRGYVNFFSERYVEVFEETKALFQKERLPIRLLPGMEAFATWDLPELLVNGKVMTLNQSRYLLMEFDFGEDPDFAYAVLDRVEAVGAKPVIAHVERYDFIQDHPQIIYEWREKGYIIQVNKGSFDGRFGRRARHCAYSLMDHGLVNVIASDAHSAVSRTPYMKDTYRMLRDEYPEKYLQVLFEENPRRICMDRPILKTKQTPL